jgi:hypothetical protein
MSDVTDVDAKPVYNACMFCGVVHDVPFCPNIKTIEWYESKVSPEGVLAATREIKSVTFKTAADYPPIYDLGEGYKHGG